VPSGGVQSLLVGQRLMEISVSCALKGNPGGLIWTSLERRPLTMAQTPREAVSPRVVQGQTLPSIATVPAPDRGVVEVSKLAAFLTAHGGLATNVRAELTKALTKLTLKA